MKREEFFKTIDEGTINGCIVGDFVGQLENKSFYIGFCGSIEKPEYIAYSIFDDENIKEEEGTDSELYFDDFYEAINKFRINGKPIVEQIDDIKSCGFIEYID